MAKKLYEESNIADIAYALRVYANVGRLKVSDMPQAVSTACHYSFEQGKTIGYNEGYDKGNQDGYDDGFRKGTDEGYHNGNVTGYQNGHQDGYAEGHRIGTEEGYSSGKADGIEEGIQTERDAIWNVIQNQGNPHSYYYAFAYNRFKDATFNPKYDMVASTSGSAMQNIFYNNKLITDTKVAIDARNVTHIGGMFYNATNLKTVRKLIVSEKIISGGNNAFSGCESLENIVIEGTINQNFDIKYSPLNLPSAVSILINLKDLSGTDKEYAYKISFHDSVWVLLDAEGDTASPHGNSWRQYVDDKCWDA